MPLRSGAETLALLDLPQPRAEMVSGPPLGNPRTFGVAIEVAESGCSQQHATGE